MTRSHLDADTYHAALTAAPSIDEDAAWDGGLVPVTTNSSADPDVWDVLEAGYPLVGVSRTEATVRNRADSTGTIHYSGGHTGFVTRWFEGIKPGTVVGCRVLKADRAWGHPPTRTP